MNWVDMKCCKLLIFLPVLLLSVSCTRDPKAQAQRYLDNGNKFFAKEKYKEAALMYRRALQKDLRFGEAYYRLGLTDLKLGAYGDAVKMLQRAVGLQPENSDAAIKLGDLYLLASTQDPQHAKDLRGEAKDLAQKLLQRDPNSFDGHRLMGQMALIENDSPTAVAEFAKANEVKPYQKGLAVAYFEALVIDSRAAAAEKRTVDAEARAAEAEKLALEEIAREKAFSPIYDLLYVKRVQSRDIQGAEDVLKLKVANNPKNAMFMLQLAGHYFQQGKTAEMDALMKRLTDEKEFPDGHMLAGDFYFFRARQYALAVQEYENAIKAFPKDKATYQRRIVEVYATWGKSQQANDLLATILKDNPKDNDAIAMRAALLLTTGNRDQINAAALDLQSLVAKMPQNHLLRFNLARALAAKNDLEQARLQLEEAVKLRPDFVAARELLGQVYLRKGDSAKALRAADELISIDNNNAQAHLIRSTALLNLGDRDKARDELDLINRNYPQNTGARYQVGLLAYQDKDFKKAGQIFGELHRADPKDIRGLRGVVEVLATEGKIPEAIKEVQKSLEMEPQRKDYQLVLENLYVRSQRFDEAIKILQELAAGEPRSAELAYKLGETYREKGDLNNAMEQFRKASQIAPNDINSLIQLALLLEGIGRRDQARPVYEQILRIQPDQFVALNNLANMKAEEGVDLDQALTMAQRARQKAPNFHEISDTLGLIYIRKSLSEDATRIFSDLVQQEPGNPKFHLHYAMALLQKGDKPRAKSELQKASQSKPSTEDAGKIKELLQTI
jgi:tetratricopeptide (TPR) repeat protein